MKTQARPKKRATKKPVEWDLCLYVAGQTPRSIAATKNLQKVCEEHLPGKFRLRVVDLLKNPKLAAGDQIIAVPILVRRLPTPLRKFIGDFSRVEPVLLGLGVQPGGKVIA